MQFFFILILQNKLIVKKHSQFICQITSTTTYPVINKQCLANIRLLSAVAALYKENTKSRSSVDSEKLGFKD